jgi:hypothetical protein
MRGCGEMPESEGRVAYLPALAITRVSIEDMRWPSAAIREYT